MLIFRLHMSLRTFGSSLLLSVILSGCAMTGGDSDARQAKPLLPSASPVAASLPPVKVSPSISPSPLLPHRIPPTPEQEKNYQAAYSAFHSRQYSEAIRLADTVLNENPTHYPSHNIKGIALCFLDKHRDGMASIDAALTLKPDDGYARFNKALAYAYHEQIPEAIAWYEKALAVENYVWSHYGIASCYGRLGDVENAVKHLKTAIAMDAGVKDVAKKEKDFSKVKNAAAFQALLR